jgi:Ca2+-binding RTX toxin-like protein
MADDYDIARQIVEAAPAGQFTLPNYSGPTNDLGYLKDWVLGLVTEIYGVDAGLFDTSTVVSTTILRDFVHRALYQVETPMNYTEIYARPDLDYDDVAYPFRFDLRGLCGDMAWQLFSVFRAFGYQTTAIHTINGPFGTWTDSHATSQVYVSDLDKYVIQDATFNFIYRDNAGEMLSFEEARIANLAGTLVFDGFADYRYYAENLVPTAELPQALQDYFKVHYLDTVYWWYGTDGTLVSRLDALFLNSVEAHNTAVTQGGVFASLESAVAEIESLYGSSPSWTDVATSLRSQGYCVSGFASSDSAGNHTAEWLTIRLATGAYISVELGTSAILHGSFDEISSELFGGAVQNAGYDLSVFAGPTYLLSVTGIVMSPGVALPTPHDVIGTIVGEELVGTTAVDRIIGLGGDDILSGGSGDYLAGGIGDDSYFVINDTVTLLEISGEGFDAVYAPIDFTLPAHVEVLNLQGSAIRGTGNSGEYWMYGNAQGNILDARGGTGHLFGGIGNDSYFIDSVGDGLAETVGEGFDAVYAYFDFTLPANVEVLNLRDTAIRGTGNSGEFWMYGNAQGNILDARGGTGHLFGGVGDDSYFIDSAGDGLAESVGEGFDAIYAYVDFTLPVNVEVLNLQGTAIRGTGNSGEFWIYGNAQGNILDARGGTGHLFGGVGNDSYFLDSAGDGLAESVGEGFDAVYAYFDFTLPANVEVLNLRDTAIRGTGNSGEFWIYGNAQNNILDARSGTGHLFGGVGDDSYFIDSAGDGLAESVGEGFDTVYAYFDFTLPANVEVLNLRDTAIRGTGNSGEFWIYGNAQNNILDARVGTGHLFGGFGDDSYLVNNSNDYVAEFTGEGFDTVYATYDLTLPDHVEVLVLQTGATNGSGNTGNNWLYGSSEDNVLNGGAGADTLWGYDGNDTFVFSTPGSGVDVVADFTTSSDIIALDHTAFGVALTGTLADAGVQFVNGTTATTTALTLLYDVSTGALSWDADGTGNGQAIQIATVSTPLTTNDFLII